MTMRLALQRCCATLAALRRRLPGGARAAYAGTHRHLGGEKQNIWKESVCVRLQACYGVPRDALRNALMACGGAFRVVFYALVRCPGATT